MSESEESEHIEIRPNHNGYDATKRLEETKNDEMISLADLTSKPLKAISKTSL